MAAKSSTLPTTAGTTAAPNTSAMPATGEELPSQIALDDSLLDPEAAEENENAFYERMYRYHQKPVKPAKVPLPDLPQRNLNLLRDHVRIINGKTPKHQHRIPIPCWMDSPEFMPKSNRTFRERGRYVRSKLEDRKDSEEDQFSSRCLL